LQLSIHLDPVKSLWDVALGNDAHVIALLIGDWKQHALHQQENYIATIHMKKYYPAFNALSKLIM
jgi:hypothetical protein